MADDYIKYTLEEEIVGHEPSDNSLAASTIRYRMEMLPVYRIAEKIQSASININAPSFRKGELWNEEKGSLFIESIILNLPVPAFYFEETDETKVKWSVIDGLQRCILFDKLINQRTFRLSGMDILGKFNGNNIDRLPQDIQRRVLQTKVMCYIVEYGTPIEMKYDIFKRVNVPSHKLSEQVIRYSLFQGKIDTFLTELSDMTEFSVATGQVLDKHTLEDHNLLARFLAFYLQGYKNYEPNLDKFIIRGLHILNEYNEAKLNEIKAIFSQVMSLAYDIWGNNAFRRLGSNLRNRAPLNLCLFEVISSAFAELSDMERQSLANKMMEVRIAFKILNSDKDFTDSLIINTGFRQNVMIRHGKFETMIKDIVNENK